MSLVGRSTELRVLDQCMETGRPEFVAIYGRRRVGKTYLVREYFKDGFAFYATGVESASRAVQLRTFGISLSDCAGERVPTPKDWFDAFVALRDVLGRPSVRRDHASGRRVVFLDELPWFDTPRSNFKTALEWFWNSWASAQADLVLVVCGSATSWIIDNLVDAHGGLYNRMTRQIRLAPFTLGESEALLRANGIMLPRRQVVECYMVFGGIPYYLNLLSRRMGLAQNIQALCFDEGGELRYERQRLFTSLFRRSDTHEAIVEVLLERTIGFSRADIARRAALAPDKALTKALSELEQCGFVRRYRNYAKREYGHFYQLVDPFTLFSGRFMGAGGPSSWMDYLNSPGYRAWTGLAFELVCLLHVPQMKRALGIEGVRTQESAWRSDGSSPGAQVDLLIDRDDGLINLCEMKFCEGEYIVDAACERALRGRLGAFMREAAPRKAVHVTLVSVDGMAAGAHTGDVNSQVTAEDLFA